MSILPKGRSFTADSGAKVAVLLKGRSSTANSGTQAAVLLGMDRCSSFPLLSAPHSLFSIWTVLKTSEKIPGAPTWRWGESIWLTGPSGLHRNLSQGLNIGSIKVFDQIRNPDIPINLYYHIVERIKEMTQSSADWSEWGTGMDLVVIFEGKWTCYYTVDVEFCQLLLTDLIL